MLLDELSARPVLCCDLVFFYSVSCAHYVLSLVFDFLCLVCLVCIVLMQYTSPFFK